MLASLYLREPAPYRYYREQLYQGIAKKALEQAEVLYKSRGASGTADGKMVRENKRMRKELKEKDIEI